MYFSTLPYIMHRSYPKFGYLTDNRNYGYDTASKSRIKVGDLVLSETGDLFYSVLGCTPQHIKILATKLKSIFKDVPLDVIIEDALTFYTSLNSEGFVFCGDKNNMNVSSRDYFSYENRKPYQINMIEKAGGGKAYETTFGDDFRLTRVHINISGRCNENCVHCYIPHDKKCGLMSDLMFDKIIEQCCEMNVLNITLSGGEPMLNPHFESFLYKCESHNLSINVLSNLTMLTDSMIDVMANNPLISVQTSLYAMDEKVHDSITGCNGSFKKTLQAIFDLHARNIPMQINCPIMRQNKHSYKDVLRFASSLNVEADADYTLYGSYDSSCSNLECRLSITEIENILREEAEDKTPNYKRQIKRHKSIEDPICSVCKHSLCISYNGDVYPCEGWQSMYLGSIEDKTLREIWKEDPKTLRLRYLKYKDFPMCATCSNKDVCSICLIMNANEDAQADYSHVNSYVCGITRAKSQR